MNVFSIILTCICFLFFLLGRHLLLPRSTPYLYTFKWYIEASLALTVFAFLHIWSRRVLEFQPLLATLFAGNLITLLYSMFTLYFNLIPEYKERLRKSNSIVQYKFDELEVLQASYRHEISAKKIELSFQIEELKGLHQFEQRLIKEKDLLVQDCSNTEMLKESLRLKELHLQEEKKTLNEQASELSEKFDSFVKETKAAFREEFEIERALLKKELEKEYERKTSSFMRSTSLDLAKSLMNEKEKVINEVYTFNNNIAIEDPIFEIKKSYEAISKQQEELSRQTFLNDAAQHVIAAEKQALQAKGSAQEIKSENIVLRSFIESQHQDLKHNLQMEIKDRQQDNLKLLHHFEIENEKRKGAIEQLVSDLKVLDKEKTAELKLLKADFSGALIALENKHRSELDAISDKVSTLKQETSQQFSSILIDLEKYHLKNQDFVNRCKTLVHEAKAQSLNMVEMQYNVKSLYDSFKSDIKILEHKLSSSMERIAMEEQGFAQAVSSTVLQLKHLSQEHYQGMKNLELERKSLDVVYAEKSVHHDMHLQEIRHKKEEIQHLQQLLSRDENDFATRQEYLSQNASLQHRLYESQSELTYQVQQASLNDLYLRHWN